MATNRHPGITMHKITFGGGFVGLLFAVGSALIFVLGFPTLWYFVAFAFALGIGIAILLNLAARWRSDRNKPLSIVTAAQTAEPRPSSHRTRRGQLRSQLNPTTA